MEANYGSRSPWLAGRQRSTGKPRSHCAVLLPLLLLLPSACRAEAKAVAIEKQVNGALLKISADPQRFAGAITSLTYRGVEYVDNFDHGRQIQSAFQLDGLGECLNPTEAGSKADAAQPRSTSKILTSSASGNELRTSTQAAFWLAPGEQYGRRCLPGRAEQRAQNRRPLSDYVISRRVSFDQAIPNLVRFDMKFSFPVAHRSAGVEALTAYLPRQFDTFHSFDPQSRILTRLHTGDAGAMTMQPVIISTADGKNALGVISRDIARRGFDRSYYAYFRMGGAGAATKWSCVFNETHIARGAELRYSCPVAVGTIAEVVEAMSRFAETEGMVPAGRRRALRNEGGTSYHSGGPAFAVFTSDEGGRTPLFACNMKGTGSRFISVRMDCEGMNPAGQIGFANPKPGARLIALRRYFDHSSGRHLITTRPQEAGRNHLRFEGILGYVPNL
jgi:hypothetical protein